MTASRCLADDQLLDLLAGRIPAEAIEQLTAHLDTCASCRLALSAAAAMSTPATAPMAPRSPRSFAVGETVGGRYRIEKFLARGGMGEVYEARDLLLDARIALKTLVAAASDDARATARLKNEVQIARKVTHDNVCRLFDLGVHGADAPNAGSGEGGLIFITMELLEGETLGQRLRRVGRLVPGDCAAVVKQLTAGLAAAHRAGVVHRDFKSDNIMLVRSADGSERVVITDFGLARLDSAGWPSAGPSGQGVMLGTMAYMAPEQVRGTPATAASDIYALGVVMYEMLTGQLPFQGDTPIATALMRLDRAPPSPRAVAASIDATWERIIVRCMALEPADRFASADQIERVLAGGIDPTPPPAPPVPGPRRLAVAVVVAGVALASVSALVLVRRPPSVPAALTAGAMGSPSPPPPAPPVAPAAAVSTATQPEPAAVEPPAPVTATRAAEPSARPRRDRPARNLKAARLAAAADGTPPAPLPTKAVIHNPAPPQRPINKDDDVIDPFRRSR